jgi:ABC-2 type transport system permease protein
MGSFFASYKNEWAKLLSRKKFIVFACIGVAICIFMGLLGRLVSGLMMGQAGIALLLAPTPMGVLPFFLHFLIPFLIFMGVTDLITVESADGTMKAMIFRPVERWKLFYSKILAVVTYAAGYLAVIFVTTVLLSIIFGDVPGVSDFFAAFFSYVLSIVPLTIMTAFAALIALTSRSGTLTMFILLISYAVLSAVALIFPIPGEVLFTSYLSWHRLWIGALPDAARLIQMLIIVLGYGVVFFTAGSLLFEKKEY